MRFLDRIFSLVWDIQDFFSLAGFIVEGWIWPFNLLAGVLYGLAWAVGQLLDPIASFSDWTVDIGDRVGNILSSIDIIGLLSPWLVYAENAWNWVLNAGPNVRGIISSWWSSAWLSVMAAVDQVKEEALGLVGQLELSLADLRKSWADFWTLTWPAMLADMGGLRSSWENFLSTSLPGLATWTGTSALIESTLRSWFPFYDDLVATWSDIALFFTDPLEYLTARLETWFWGDEI